MESKDLLTLCQQNGLDIRNQLSTIEPEVRDQILLLVKRVGAQSQPQQTGTPPPAQVIPPTTRRIVNLDDRARAPGARPEPARPTTPPARHAEAPAASGPTTPPAPPVAPEPAEAAPAQA